MELPEDTPVGVDICDLYAIKDMVFEVDNKSLTNRPTCGAITASPGSLPPCPAGG